jgi:copper chaperone CopZ
VERVGAALEEIPSVNIKNVELGSALLEFNSKLTTSEAIIHALDALGFPARSEI